MAQDLGFTPGPAVPDAERVGPRTLPVQSMVCFPPAGGSNWTFRALAAAGPVAESFTVRYSRRPGKDTQQSVPDVRDLAEAVAARLRTDVGATPRALVGASLGALVALETAQRLGGDAGPAALVVAACAAPRWCGFGRGQKLDDASLIDFVTRCGAPNPAILSDPVVRRSVLTRLRQDLEMLRGYGGPPMQPLSCPIVSIRGESDRLVADWMLRDWAECTTGPFASITVPGPHLFFQDRAGIEAFWRGLADHGVISPSTPTV